VIAAKGNKPTPTPSKILRIPACACKGEPIPSLVQTARLLFRMSLLHLPLYLLLFVIHRIPNTGHHTWQSYTNLLQRSCEDVEMQMLQNVHGSYPEQLAGSFVEGPMLFPFSPPLMLPCPYHELKQGILSVCASQPVAGTSYPAERFVFDSTTCCDPARHRHHKVLSR
jgi:hypothetical protein